jgi:hypothetical protein
MEWGHILDAWKLKEAVDLCVFKVQYQKVLALYLYELNNVVQQNI